MRNHIRFLAIVSAVTVPAATAQDVFNSNSRRYENCAQEQAAETDRHRRNLADLQKEAMDITTEYRNDTLRCKHDRGCMNAAREKRDHAMTERNVKVNEEQNRYSKALLDIKTNCRGKSQPVSRSTPPPSTSQNSNGIRAEEVITPEGRRLMFQLGAEMNEIASQQNTGTPGGEFMKGLAEWAGGTLEMLAQKPGVPVEQMAKGFLDYLTNDNAANHKALQAAAQQAVQEFQQNPARFLGKNLPDMLPTPAGGFNKAKALERIAKVEKAANRIKQVAQAEKKVTTAYSNTIQQNQRFGAQAGNKCFASNACFVQSLGEAELFKTGGPLGNGTGWKIRGTYGPDMTHTPEQIFDRLKPYGEGFAPRRPGTYNPEQLDMIWKGEPIPMNGPEDIARIVEREGVGNQGIVFVEMEPGVGQKPGDPLGHAFNVRNENGVVKWVDTTTPGMDPLFLAPVVRNWFFFPIQ